MLHVGLEVAMQITTNTDSIVHWYALLADELWGKVCGIIPCLSQLKDSKRYNSCIKIRTTYLRNVELCLKPQEGNAGKEYLDLYNTIAVYFVCALCTYNIMYTRNWCMET